LGVCTINENVFIERTFSKGSSSLEWMCLQTPKTHSFFYANTLHSSRTWQTDFNELILIFSFIFTSLFSIDFYFS
jgi:hypothetical protein